MHNWLVTGGCGFIGSNFIRLVLRERPQVRVFNFDALTYAGNPENLSDLAEDERYTFRCGDVADADAVAAALGEDIDAVIHFAAESHVDRSLLDAGPFLRTNVLGTGTLLDACRRRKAPPLFLHVSTDEVYGSLGATGSFVESHPLRPNSPYAASKAASDLLVLAYRASFGLPVRITRSSNNYGPYQFPEKAIPLFLSNAMEDRPLPVYGDGRNVRDWVHVEDNCRGILAVLEKGKDGEVYNLGGRAELTNLELTRTILRVVGKPETLITFVADRPGHDLRYALDCTKAGEELGWSARVAFEDGLRATAAWYRDHADWWRRVKAGAYRDYYRRQYGQAYEDVSEAEGTGP